MAQLHEMRAVQELGLQKIEGGSPKGGLPYRIHGFTGDHRHAPDPFPGTGEERSLGEKKIGNKPAQ